MYKVGKYQYKSKKHYEMLLIVAGSIFLISIFNLVALQNYMPEWLYLTTVGVSIIMSVHLFFRYAKSKNWIKEYMFNEY